MSTEMRKLVSHIATTSEKGSPSIYAVQVKPDAGSEYYNMYEVWLTDDPNDLDADVIPFCFQKGPVPEVGINGLTLESLIAICIDRLDGFQKAGLPCVENEKALDHLNRALESLHTRTRNRIATGKIGTYKP